MIAQRSLVGLFFIVIAQLTLAEDDLMPEYAVVSGWSIRIDTTLNNGCFALATYEKGSVLRVGIDNRDDTVYVIFGNPDWKSIEYGKNYDVEIQFGNETEWSGTAKGISFKAPENQPYLAVTIATEDAVVNFIREYMSEKWVEFFYDGNSIDKLTLEGSYAAGMKILECQKNMRSNDHNSKDPFAHPGSSNDPFAT